MERDEMEGMCSEYRVEDGEDATRCCCWVLFFLSARDKRGISDDADDALYGALGSNITLILHSVSGVNYQGAVMECQVGHGGLRKKRVSLVRSAVSPQFRRTPLAHGSQPDPSQPPHSQPVATSGDGMYTGRTSQWYACGASHHLCFSRLKLERTGRMRPAPLHAAPSRLRH